MSTVLWCIAVAAITFLVVAWAYDFEPPVKIGKCFRKPAPKRVQVPAKPGTFIELAADDGEVVGVVGLLRIERDFDAGLTVVFKDFTHFMTDRRVRDRDEYDDF